MREAMYTVVALILVGLGAVGGFFLARTSPVGQPTAAGAMVFTPGGSDGQGSRPVAVMKAVGPEGVAIASTVGSVKSVEGNTVEVETADGSVKVNLSDQTTIQQTVMQTMKPQDLKPGARIVVLGDKNSSGGVDARSINLMAE